MPEYRVVWEIDITADTPRAAARQALTMQRDPASIATVFTVTENGRGPEVEVDVATATPEEATLEAQQWYVMGMMDTVMLAGQQNLDGFQRAIVEEEL